MGNQCLLSLCIPTNGVTEWVIPVLKSILAQDVNKNLYEIIITDNGNNRRFYTEIQNYTLKYHNIIYRKTDVVGFLNQVEAFKLANGLFIKFINHRMTLKEGALKYLISFVSNYKDLKPVIYFSNGRLDFKYSINSYTSFDEFVLNLSYYSSWSAGLAFWKKDLDKMLTLKEYNLLFPHTDFLFFDKNNSNYIIDNTVLLKELPTDDAKKGSYNLFYAFAVEYPLILLNLMRENYISINTFLKVINENKKFLVSLYYDFIVLKKECSYILENFDEYLNIFYDIKDIKRSSRRNIILKVVREVKNHFFKHLSN